MADNETDNELSHAKRVYSVIDEATGEPIIGVYLWNTGLLRPVFDDKTKPKRQRQGVADALILLANETR